METYRKASNVKVKQFQCKMDIQQCLESANNNLADNKYNSICEANYNQTSSETHTRSCNIQPTKKQSTPLLCQLQGVALGLVLFWSSLLGVCCFHGVVVLLLWLPLTHTIYRRVADAMVYSWIMYCAALMEYLLGIRIVVTGDTMPAGERALILMNHRTRLDWMYFWGVLVRQPAGVSREKIILKAPLKMIPGAGWAMQVGAFIFIDRNWDKDKKILDKMIGYFADLKHKTQVLLFPEGTDLTARTRQKSDEFARKNGVAPYEYVLHPRTTGFTYLATSMKELSHLDAVYDVTVGYPVNIPQKESDLLTGNFPKEVHFHIKRHAVQSLPLTEQGLQDWCKSRWAEKEQRLKSFYENRQFDTTETSSSRQQAESGDGVATKNKDNQHSSQRPTESQVHRNLILVLLYWTSFMCGIVWLLYISSLVRYIALLQIIFFVYMGHKYGGFELFQVDYFNRYFRKKSTKQS